MATATIAQLRNQQNADAAALLNPLLNQPHYSRFDPDAWHVMQERDNALIRDELLHGAASNAFVYNFDIKGKPVSGVSVVGARELASQYKGIKSRIVATIEKRGSLFIFRTFAPLSIETRVLHELAEDDDFYECVMEVSDIKTGNSLEVRKKESRTEKKRDGTTYERPHYDVICESKAFRNGVLSVLPQSVIREFKERCLKAGNSSQEATIQQRRAAAAAHAVKNGIALDRNELDGLTYDELTGLSAAAGQGLDQFKRAAMALGLIPGANAETGELPPAPPPAKPTPTAAAPAAAPAPDPADDWAPSAAEEAAIRAREQADAAGQATASAPAPTARRTRVAGNPSVE